MPSTRRPKGPKGAAGVARTVVLGISGASGAAYGVRVLQALSGRQDVRVHLVVTAAARALVRDETGLGAADLESMAYRAWPDSRMESPLASGSFRVDATAVVPCSMSTVGKLASGVADTLLTRACAVALKERRRLVVVAREMPLSTVDLRNLTTLSEAGAVVMVASPPFYTHPRKVDDLVDLVAGRVLQSMGLDPGDLLKRYMGPR
jgi:polyprenyl P-hydroxybenzoate/phenylacrylic acid decarboxylase-like protein